MMLASAASDDMDLMALPPRRSSCIVAKDQGGCGQTACSQSECSALRHCFHSPVCTHPDAHLDDAAGTDSQTRAWTLANIGPRIIRIQICHCQPIPDGIHELETSVCGLIGETDDTATQITSTTLEWHSGPCHVPLWLNARQLP